MTLVSSTMFSVIGSSETGFSSSGAEMSAISFCAALSSVAPTGALEAPGVWSWCCVICTSCAAASLPGSICNARVNWFSAPARSPFWRSTRPRSTCMAAAWKRIRSTRAW